MPSEKFAHSVRAGVRAARRMWVNFVARPKAAPPELDPEPPECASPDDGDQAGVNDLPSEKWIVDKTALGRFDQKHRSRQLRSIKRVILHRISMANDDPDQYEDVFPIPDDELDADAVIEKFRDVREFRHGSYTAGRRPYHFLVPSRDDAPVEQMPCLTCVGAHASRYNKDSVGIAVVGDFRRQAVSLRQWIRVVTLCAILNEICQAQGEIGLMLSGHTDLPDAAEDMNKTCPGEGLPRGILLRKHINDVQTQLHRTHENHVDIRMRSGMVA